MPFHNKHFCHLSHVANVAIKVKIPGTYTPCEYQLRALSSHCVSLVSLLTGVVMTVLCHLPIASYEIHLSEEVRRKGLGKFLMQILELLAARYSMGIQACVFSFIRLQRACGPSRSVHLLCLRLSISCKLALCYFPRTKMKKVVLTAFKGDWSPSGVLPAVVACFNLIKVQLQCFYGDTA